ncbi:MAG: hypothetical protein RRC07_07865 [Anaerolineae bacterium]|nr:hypothetical protein [Anaerolineae bacterium]
MILLGRLYAILYESRQRRLFGVTWRTWLVILPVILAVAGLGRGWPFPLIVALFALTPLLLLLYTVARRAGYKHFVPDTEMALDDTFAAPRNEHRIALHATGIFSLHDREDYVLARPAEYWRVPLGQHVIMVQQTPGRFLYQIIDPENVERIQPGHLFYGRNRQKALALHFLASWGPQFVYEPSYRYVGDDDEPPPSHTIPRTVYLTFSSDADRHAVWKSMLLERARR